MWRRRLGKKAADIFLAPNQGTQIKAAPKPIPPTSNVHIHTYTYAGRLIQPCSDERGIIFFLLVWSPQLYVYGSVHASYQKLFQDTARARERCWIVLLTVCVYSVHDNDVPVSFLSTGSNHYCWHYIIADSRCHNKQGVTSLIAK
jgi:hypothetical protein